MNTDTVLRVAADGRGRMVWLEKGEAYFQVRHDDAHPFTVMAGGHRVTDLGTKFLVRTDAQRLQVSLVEGSIRFDAPDGRMREPLLLSPGDSVTAKENTIVVTRNSPRELAKDLGWRRGVLVFDNTTLAAAAAEFNRYNREKIVIADQSVAQLRIDGTFPNENLSVFAHAAQQLFELHIVERDGKTVISR
jgi:transmembrane sensor